MVSRELISKATRNRFREILVGFVLRDIDMIFEEAGFSPKEDYDPPFDGARRTRVEQYYAGIDFNSAADIKKLLFAYSEIFLRLSRYETHRTGQEDLLRLMKRDGYEFDGESFVLLPASSATTHRIDTFTCSVFRPPQSSN